jgi:hypothetical protein
MALGRAARVPIIYTTGITTSGCVRATVVDAACYSFYVGVVDMHAKYGTVISLREATAYLQTRA